MTPAIALIGDYSREVIAHRAIPPALELASRATGIPIRWRWIQTRAIQDAARDLDSCAAVWAIPASPYENTAGVLDAIRWARVTGRPFLGTCGGFQHMVIEFARNVAGIAEADNAETNPGGRELVITPLPSPQVDVAHTVRFAPGSKIREAYGKERSVEGYSCSYGVNPDHAATLEHAGFRFTAWDEYDAVRAAEWPEHPFFVGTLFQPERAALQGAVPPLVAALVKAVGNRGKEPGNPSPATFPVRVS